MKCPHCKKEVTGLSFEKKKVERLELILSFIQKGMKLNKLFKSLTRSKLNKYPFNRFGFDRDIKTLKHLELVEIYINFDNKFERNVKRIERRSLNGD